MIETCNYFYLVSMMIGFGFLFLLIIVLIGYLLVRINYWKQKLKKLKIKR
jgi:cytochrome bd-type quinol oxidase subunit 1